jgi:hypothetical protein
MEIVIRLDGGVAPLGFHRYATEFLRAAQRFEPQDEGFSPVPYYLACRSIELALKSYLLARGLSLKQVKCELNHSLVKALQRASDLGLASLVEVSEAESRLLGEADALYSKKHFEYFENLGLGFQLTQPPDIDELTVLASKLTVGLETAARRAVNGPIDQYGVAAT